MVYVTRRGLYLLYWLSAASFFVLVYFSLSSTATQLLAVFVELLSVHYSILCLREDEPVRKTRLIPLLTAASRYRGEYRRYAEDRYDSLAAAASRALTGRDDDATQRIVRRRVGARLKVLTLGFGILWVLLELYAGARASAAWPSGGGWLATATAVRTVVPPRVAVTQLGVVLLGFGVLRSNAVRGVARAAPVDVRRRRALAISGVLVGSLVLLGGVTLPASRAVYDLAKGALGATDRLAAVAFVAALLVVVWDLRLVARSALVGVGVFLDLLAVTTLAETFGLSGGLQVLGILFPVLAVSVAVSKPISKPLTGLAMRLLSALGSLGLLQFSPPDPTVDS